MKYWLINQSEKQLCNLSYEHLSGTSEKMKKTFSSKAAWDADLHARLVSPFRVFFFFILNCGVFIKRRLPKQSRGRSSFTLCVFCFLLCWIPRHSPKVVKAASQVLNSMWQYRDLRSLYKKVKPLYSGYINPESVQLHVKPLQGN